MSKKMGNNQNSLGHGIQNQNFNFNQILEPFNVQKHNLLYN